MRKPWMLLFLLPLVLCSFSLSAQTKSRVAVLPFTAVEVPASEARVVTSLFETALVKTGVYNVIEQNQITEILDAQAFSLSGCTDDACAVEVGKLLAAELIILGELSRLGGRYIANAKIIDVGLGRNVNADSVSAADVVEMTDSGVTLLAYKLAGLTYTEGGGERIADAFGEIYVSTTPDGAEIFINGMRRGTSPLVVDKVPLGSVRVTARKDNLVGESIIELKSADLVEVDLALKISQGRLFIKSSEKEVEVFLDGESLGPLSGGLFRDLSSGDHTLTLKGDGLFWEGPVVLEADKTVTVEASPTPYGTLDYRVPDDAVLTLFGSGGTKHLSGLGTVNLTIGSYRASTSGDHYLPREDMIEIARGQTVSYAPEMDLTEEYRVVLEDKLRQEAESSFREDLEDLEGRVAHHTGGSDEVARELDESRLLRKNLEASEYDFPELLQAAVALNLAALANRMEELEALTAAAKQQSSRRKISRWTALGIGAAAFTVTGIYHSLGATEYRNYLAALTTTASEALHSRLQSYTVLQVGGAIVGTGAALTGLLLSSSRVDEVKAYTAEAAALSAERAALEGGR
ncbi:MAG: PEGA domain-containing protein [Spirochaetales bacterium]|nr:PEGA domain-containing protein [Spirochaetales bacterium]